MKTIRYLLLTGMTVASLCGARSVLAQTTTTTPPVVVVPNDDKDLYQDLRGVPKVLQTLIVSFDKTRDKYLAAQDLLLRKLKDATTAAEREQIRDQLQENRQDFLAALKSFREQLQDDLTALKGKISHEEFLRIIDAAHDAATEGGLGHHRGH
jgi:mevalonate kinase